MGLKILVVAHAPLASALQAVACHVHPDCNERVVAVDVDPAQCQEDVLADLQARIDGAAAVLVLTDAFGATPSNAAVRLAATLPPGTCRVVAGCNVPMLWRVLAHADLPLDALAQRAVEGGIRAIVQASPTPPQFQGSRLADTAHEIDRHDQQ